MKCKPNYLYVNRFLEIRILSEAKNPKFSYTLLQKKIEDFYEPVVGVTDKGKHLLSGLPSRNNLLVELEKYFSLGRSKYHITNLFDMCSFFGDRQIQYKTAKSNKFMINNVDMSDGILYQTYNRRCILHQTKYNEDFYIKINKLGAALCK